MQLDRTMWARVLELLPTTVLPALVKDIVKLGLSRICMQTPHNSWKIEGLLRAKY